MAMRSGLFDSTEVVETVGGFPRGNRAETADFFAAYFSNFVGNGIYITPATNFQVLPQSGLSVRIRPGKCFINGYFGFDDAAEDKTFAIDTSPHEYWLVLRLDLASGSIAKTWLTDPAAGSLPLRNTVIYDLAVAKITISANASAVTDAMITDLRSNTFYCGYVKSLVDGIGANVAYADVAGELTTAAASAFLPAAGGAMTGALTLPGNPTDALHAAPKQYVDARAPQLVELVRYTSSGTFNTATYPSAGNRYTVMLLGAGGAGGTNAGGGAGAMLWFDFVSGSPMVTTSFSVIVGAGSTSSDGGNTTFGRNNSAFIAPGGKKSANGTNTGAGGTNGIFTGDSPGYGGGITWYGDGANNDKNATGYGSGGYAARPAMGGLVIIYGYR